MAVKFPLQKGYFLGTRKTLRCAPLLAASQGASKRNNDCVSDLIKHDVNVGVQIKKSGKSASHPAVENDQMEGYVRLIWLLVHAGAGIIMSDKNGDFLLTKVFFGVGSLPLKKYRLGTLVVLLRTAQSRTYMPAVQAIYLCICMCGGKTSGLSLCFLTKGQMSTQGFFR
ncbi:hypothetical protein J7T55_010721 [Diaporthe amygdali]|uniref:uncharacterized protein n=1 Tax=Phomopsis amygdali TaxID=1214568 RepID=UPI0022FE9C72|nr:uncharacterized protein J7T55_010721 [Diaporthe amygdali]KAJ0114332.1 hypothetical protein J7T55_010721 [Diaporthe amygdali]